LIHRRAPRAPDADQLARGT